MPANSQDLIDIKSIRDGTIFLESGTLCQIVMVGGINFSLKSETEQGTITAGYQNFLNSIDFPIQIIVHSRKVNIEHYLSSLDERKAKEISGLLQNQISEYQEFIRGFVQEYAVMRKMFLIVVPFTPITLGSTETFEKYLPFLKSKPKQKDKDASAPSDQVGKEHEAQLKQRVSQVVDGLRTIGLEAVVLGEDQIIELLYNFYNPETVERRGVPLPKEEGASGLAEAAGDTKPQ